MAYLNQKDTASDFAYGYMENSDGAIVRVPKTALKDAIGVTALENARTDADILAMLDGTVKAYKDAMHLFFYQHGGIDADTETITALCNEWYTLTRDSWSGYTEFYQTSVSAVSTGTKSGDNAGLSCTPSTDTVANQDDYAGLPLFACVDVNWIVDTDTLEPMITAIDGIHDGFVRTDPSVYVGVMQMTGYHFWREDSSTYMHGVSSKRAVPYANMEPYPEAVRVDGTVRPWVVHGKYPAKKTSTGALTCCSGVIPTAWLSHNTVHTASKVNGAQYSGSTSADRSFLTLMAMIKYGLTLDGILQGCVNANYQYNALVAESDVRRVLITVAQAANFAVGMGVLIGTYNASASSPLDRGTAALYSVTGQAGAKITAIETVTVNGTEYGAVYVDTDDTFGTAANGAATDGTTYISSFHWPTGSTDGVLGNDGSPVSCTSGKYPAKLQGIEIMPGGYEILADVILKLYADDDSEYWYEPYIVKKSANQSTSITSNYVATGLLCAQPSSDSWQYIKKQGYALGTFFPIEVGGSSTTFTRDAIYLNSKVTGTRECLAFCSLYNGVGSGGLSCLNGHSALSLAAWNSLARLSANGNRGEWAA